MLPLKIGNGGILNVLYSVFFFRTLDPTTAVERRDRSGNLIGPNLELVGKTWYNRFLSRHPALTIGNVQSVSR